MLLIEKERENEIIYWEDGQYYTWVKNNAPVTLGDLEKEIIKKYEKQKKNINFRKPKMFNSEQIKKIKELKRQGFSNIKIAKIMNCSEGTIRNYLKRP